MLGVQAMLQKLELRVKTWMLKIKQVLNWVIWKLTQFWGPDGMGITQVYVV